MAGKLAPPAGVALTFDDGPDPHWTPRVLDALDRVGAPATFFVLASRAACYPELIDRIEASGHELAFHGNLHLRHDTHPAATIETDTAEGLKLLRGLRLRLWRPPNGIVAPVTEELASRHALELAGWTADSVDWQDEQTPELMMGRLHELLVPGAVVLMHDAIGPGALRPDPAPTVGLVEPLVAEIRSRGLEPQLFPS